MKNKFFGLLVLVVIFSVILFVPCTINADVAEGDFTYTISDNKATVIYCNRSVIGEVVIPDTIREYPVTAIGDNAFSNCKNVTGVKIPDTVTTIGKNAFSECKNLKSINMPEELTFIDENAFYSCNSLNNVYATDVLSWCNIRYGNVCSVPFYCVISDRYLYIVGEPVESITIPEGITTVNAYAFYRCNNIKTVKISDTVTSIGEKAFYGCSGMTDITVPNSVTSIGKSAFSSCSGLTAITLPDSIEIIAEETFYQCKNINTITIPDKVKVIERGAFSNCTALLNITVPDGVETIGDSVFRSCTGLRSVDIADSVDTIGNNVFSGCINMKSIKLPAGITKIGSSAFSSCASLTEIIIPSGVTQINDYTFYNCSSLNNITIPENVTFIGEYAFYGFSSLQTVTIPDKVESIGEAAFRNCKNLSELVISDGVSSIGGDAFYDCSSLRILTLSSNVKAIGENAFYGCSDLENVYIKDITAWINIAFKNEYSNPLSRGASLHLNGVLAEEITIPNGVEHIKDYTFYYCRTLKNIILPDSISSIGAYAFGICDGLTEIVIPVNVTQIKENAFYGCSNLQKMVLPDNLESIGAYAFYNCANLTDITIPDTIISIEEGTFYGCNSLETITIPNKVESIGKYAFRDCNTLKRITIPDGVTEIAEDAFGGCAKMNYVSLPVNLTTIGKNAFSYCKALTYINIPASVTSIGGGAFKDCSALKRAYITDLSAWCGIDFGDIYSIPYMYSGGGDLYVNGSRITKLVIPDNVTKIKYGAFSGCKGITEVVIPDGVTSIGNSAFEWCTNMTGITIPESVTYIGDYAFVECKNLTNINLPDAITSIGRYTFYNCLGLTDIVIPTGVSSIGEYAFSGCTNLKSVYKHSTSKWKYDFSDIVVLYDYVITYMLNGAELKREYVLSSSSAKLLTPPYGYVYKYLVEGQPWSGESVLNDTTVTVTKVVLHNIKYTGDYTATVQVEHLSDAKLPEPPYGYTYSFTAGGGEWTGKAISQNVTVTVKKTPNMYTVTYTGDYEDSVQAEYLSNVTLPEPPYGYTYTFTVNGEKWTGKEITEDITVKVVKTVSVYKVTFVGDYTGEVMVEHLSNVTLPAAPDGYIYTFTQNGRVWTGEDIVSDVTVTVTELCDLATVIVNNLEQAQYTDNTISGIFYKRTYIPELTVLDSASYKCYLDYECKNEITEINLNKGENIFYIKVIAQSGREELYTLKINRDIPDSLGNLAVIQTIGGSLTLQLDAEIKGSPQMYVYYGTRINEMVCADAQYISDTNTFVISGLYEDTLYYLMLVAEYDEIMIESNIVLERTGITLSDDCYVISTLIPPNGTIIHGETENDIGVISGLAVTNKFDSITIDVEVSKGATWGLYRTASSGIEIDKTVSLNAGKTVTMYIKVTSESKEHQRIYSITIYRQSKSDKPVITVLDNMVTISAENSSIIYTVDKTEPSENNGLTYTLPFEVENGTTIKAIAKANDKDEYSDIETFVVNSNSGIRIVPIEVYKDGNKYFYGINVECDTVVSGKVIIAFYDNYDNFIAMSCTDVSGQVEYYVDGKATIDTDATKYKVFVLESFKSVKPLSKAVGGYVE